MIWTFAKIQLIQIIHRHSFLIACYLLVFYVVVAVVICVCVSHFYAIFREKFGVYERVRVKYVTICIM